jgi:hypothetical protein
MVTAVSASRAGKVLGETATFEIAAELAFDRGRAGSDLAAVAGKFEPVATCVCTVR